MRPIIGNSTVVPHIIKGVRGIKAVVTIIDGVLRHIPFAIVCAVEEEGLPSIVG